MEEERTFEASLGHDSKTLSQERNEQIAKRGTRSSLEGEQKGVADGGETLSLLEAVVCKDRKTLSLWWLLVSLVAEFFFETKHHNLITMKQNVT